MPTQITTGPLTNKIQKIVASDLDTDKELLESLFAVSHVIPANSIRYRRNLRSELEEQLLKLYESLLEELENVKNDVGAMNSHVECMLSSCRTINDELSEMKEKTNSFMTKASNLQRENAKSDLKVNILECLSHNFQLPPPEKELLCSKDTAINSAFFAALHHARSIERSCRDLMHSSEHNFGMSMLDVIHGTLEEAYQHLYLWTQNECRTKTQSTTEVSLNLRDSIHELQDRPVLLKYALDEYAGARRAASVKSFIDALTLGADAVSSHNGHHSRPIDLHSHDPLRYTSDMLAWIHQLTASENEYLNSLTRSLNESVIADLRVLYLDKITEGLCSLFKARMEQLMTSLQDVVLLYRVNNILRFYEHTLQ
ncbi:unnamed protein product [Dicrocoelium dendriticum]|nr:unnamed protein product [Dicrocoelium dendriticum]